MSIIFEASDPVHARGGGVDGAVRGRPPRLEAAVAAAWVHRQPLSAIVSHCQSHGVRVIGSRY